MKLTATKEAKFGDFYHVPVQSTALTFEDKWIAKYAEFEESASINECLPVSGAMNSDIRPIWPGTRTCGRAFTVLCRSGDNLILQKALTMLTPAIFFLSAAMASRNPAVCSAAYW